MIDCSIKRWQNILLVSANSLFLLLFIILSFYNRFAVDDYYHIHDEHLFGIWGGMLEGYYHWGGRWTSYLLWDLIYYFHEYPFVLFMYSFSVIICFVLAVYLLLRRIFELFEIVSSKFLTLNYSVLFSAFTFLMSFSKSEIWFWVQSTAMFVFSIIAFLFGLGIIAGKKSKYWHFFFLAICFTYAGGASETYALFYIFPLLLFCCFFLFFKEDRIIKRLKERALGKILFSIIFLVAAFIISYMAPGNAIRATWLPEPSFFSAFYITVKSLGKLILFKMPMQLPWIMLFSVPWIFLGFAKGEKQLKFSFYNFYKRFLVSLIFLVILIYCMLFPACYVLSEIGPDRSLSQVVLLISGFCSVWAFVFGYRYLRTGIIFKYLFYCSLTLIIASFIVITILQFRAVSNYAAALDKRTENLLELQKNNNKKTINLDELPSSGFLYSAEISSDTSYFGNKHYAQGLFLDFTIRKK
jgi:hypothetical protein